MKLLSLIISADEPITTSDAHEAECLFNYRSPEERDMNPLPIDSTCEAIHIRMDITKGVRY